MKAEAPSEGLCLSCGLCCDGTVFRQVPLDNADALIPLRAVGIEVEGGGAGRFFKQPCAAYRHDCCQVYASRPASCRAYRCKVLRKFERGALSMDEAQRQIGRMRMLKDVLKAELSHLVPGDPPVVVVKDLVPTPDELAADADLRTAWAPVLLRLAALLDCLQRDFQPDIDGGSVPRTVESDSGVTTGSAATSRQRHQRERRQKL